jgi:hypothetical protein
MKLNNVTLRARRGLVGSVVAAVALSVIGIGGMLSSAHAATSGWSIVVNINNDQERNLHAFKVLHNGVTSQCFSLFGYPTVTQIEVNPGEQIAVYAYTDDTCQTFRGDGGDSGFFTAPNGGGFWNVTL